MIYLLVKDFYKIWFIFRLINNKFSKKVLELFNLVENLDTSELLHYSLSNQIPFDVIYEDNGNSLIHIVIKMDKRKLIFSPNLKILFLLLQMQDL